MKEEASPHRLLGLLYFLQRRVSENSISSKQRQPYDARPTHTPLHTPLRTPLHTSPYARL